MLIFNEQSCILARRFDEYAKQPNQTHDLYPYISACTLDIIAEAATGTHPQAQAGSEKNEVVQATVRIGDIINVRMRSPWMWPNFIFNQLPIGHEHGKLLKILHGFSRKIIEERLATFNTEEVTNNDDNYRNQIIRKGTTVFIFIFGIHKDASVFPNPDKFDPERFAENSLISDERSPFAFILFSSGSRNCIGQHFAALEERVVLSTLFHHFSFRSTQTIDQLHLSIDAIL